MSNTYYGLGYIEYADARDKLYPMSSVLPERPFITKKMWWDNGWWGDQGNTSMCTVYSWSHWVEDGPLLQDGLGDRPKPLFDLQKLYHHAQLNDGIPGTNYGGSTIRAVAKILKEMNVINEYRWAESTDDITTCLLTLGPVVVGTRWFSAMFSPDNNGLIHPNGGLVGGHAYLLNGVDLDKGLYRIKNSWSKNWGVGGHAYISIEDFGTQLLASGGQACMALANKLSVIPDIDKIQDNDVA